MTADSIRTHPRPNKKERPSCREKRMHRLVLRHTYKAEVSSGRVSAAARRHGPLAGAGRDRPRRAGVQLGARHPQLLGRRGLRGVRARRRRRARGPLPLPPQVRARRRGWPESQGGGVGADDAAHCHVRVQGRAAHAAGRRRRCLGDGGGHRGGRLLGLLPCLITYFTLPDDEPGMQTLYLLSSCS